MSPEAVKIGRELLSSNIALGTRICKAESWERDAQAVREPADAKLVKVSSDADEVVEFRRRQAAFGVSVKELTTELTRVKAQFVQRTAEKLEQSTKLGPVASYSDKRLEVLASVRGARVRLEGLAWSIVDQSVGRKCVCQQS